MKPETMAALIRRGRMHGSMPGARYAWALWSDPAGAFVVRMRKAAGRLPIADVVLSSSGSGAGHADGFPVLVKAERGVSPADVTLIEDEILAAYEKLRMGFDPLVLSRLRLAAQARGLRGFPIEAVVRILRRVNLE